VAGASVEVSAEGNKSDRLILTAIWYVLRTGLPWRDVPSQRNGETYRKSRRGRQALRDQPQKCSLSRQRLL
jgi:transposase